MLPVTRFTAVLALLGAFAALAAAGTLKIAFTGYVHGGFTSSVDGNFCSVLGISDTEPSSNCIGGCDRREAFLRSKKADDPSNTILADLGSYYWGSVYYTMFGIDPGVECFSRVGYDISSLGGSDMYGGYEEYGQFVETMTSAGTDFLGTNMSPGTNKSDPLNNRVRRSFNMTLDDGTMIGVVSPLSSTYVATAGIPATGTQANVASTKDNLLRAEIYRLRKAGAAAVVLMVEMTRDITADLGMIRELENVAAVLISRSPNPGVRVETNVFGDEFLVVALPDDNGATIGWFEAEIAPVDPASHPSGLVSVAAAAATSQLVPVVASMPAEPTTRTLFEDSYNLPADADFTRKLGKAIGPISGASGTTMEAGNHGCRTASCPMGRLLTDAVEPYCSLATSEDHGHGKCLVMINSGAIRSSFNPPAGTPEGEVYPVRAADIYEVLPFFNTLVRINITGATVLGAIANSYSNWPNQSGRYLQTNLRVSFNPFPNPDINDSDPANRVLDVQALLPPPQGGEPVWAPINREQVYEVLTTNYLTEGHDGYDKLIKMSRDAPRASEAGASLADALVAMVSTHSIDNPLKYPTVEEEGDCLSASLPLPEDSPCRTVYVDQTYSEFNTCPTDLDFCHAHENSFIFETMWVSPNCNTCSGAGSCVARKCTCSGAHTITEPGPRGTTVDVTYVFVAGVPTAGRWAGTLMLRGDACNEVRGLSRLSEGARISMYVAAGIAYVASIVWFIVVFILRNKPVVRASSPKFSLLMCVGGMVGATSIIMDASPARTITSCNASVWLLVIGYSLLFACLFVKTHRIHHIFNAKMLKGRATYTDLWVLFYVFLITLINIAILLIFRLVAPLEPSLYPIPGRFAIGERCAGDEIAFTVMLIVYNGLLLGWGIYLAVRTRNVDSNFNESKYIGACIYNCALSGIVILLLAYVARDSEFTVVNIIMSWGIAYVIVSTLCIVLIPRVNLYIDGVSAGSNASRSLTQADVERQVMRDRRTIQMLVERMKLHDAAVEERDQVIALLSQQLKDNSIEPPVTTLTMSDDPAISGAGAGGARGSGVGGGLITERHSTASKTNVSSAEGVPSLQMQRPAFAGHGGGMLQVNRSMLSSNDPEEGARSPTSDTGAVASPQGEGEGIELSPM